jgi:hypothetical protein
VTNNTQPRSTRNKSEFNMTHLASTNGKFNQLIDNVGEPFDSPGGKKVTSK